MKSTQESQASTPQTTKNQTTTRQTLIKAARIIAALIVCAAVAYSLVNNWSDVKDVFTRLTAGTIAAALICAVLALGLQTLLFRTVLSGLGYRVGVAPAAQVYLIGLLAKYVPGSVWMFVLQAQLGKRHGIPRNKGFLAVLVSFAISSAAGAIIGLPAIAVLWKTNSVLAAVITAAMFGIVIGVHPRILTWGLRVALRVTRRPPLEQQLNWATVRMGLVWSTLAWLCFGMHLWLLSEQSHGSSSELLLRCLGLFALAVTAGTLAIFAPGGLGVREAVIVGGLLPYMSAAAALAVALASRLLVTIAEVVAAGLAALTMVKQFGKGDGASETGLTNNAEEPPNAGDRSMANAATNTS